jgi:hypothetical protein
MGTSAMHCGHDKRPDSACGTVPELERICYFFGQMLEPADFRAEQGYFMTLLALLGRFGVGWGVACGLDVCLETGPPDHCDDQPEHERLALKVTPGAAIDCCGRLIVVRKPCSQRLWDLLCPTEREALLAGQPLYVTIEHAEQPVRPTRGLGEGCDPLASVQYGRIRDGSRIVVSLECPEQHTCDRCLDPCPDAGVLLASIRLTEPGKSAQAAIQPELRRLLARHELAAITGLGWVHGGTYDRRSAEALLTAGVKLRFSRPVRLATLQEGVADVVVYEGGGGRRDTWYFKAVELDAGPEDHGLVNEVGVRVAQPEGFQSGDRILLRVRCDFILDECCRAVSGAHLGGAIPFDPALADSYISHPAPAALPCPHPPDREGPWRSGNGVEGGVFESWIKVDAGAGSHGEGGGTTP